MRGQRKFGVGAAAFGVAMVVSSLVVGHAGAAVSSNPTQYTGNVTTCEDVGYPGSTQLEGAITSGNGGNSVISYTVTDNKYVTLTSVDVTVTIQVVVVKGGDHYNVYNPAVVGMQSPLNGGGQVPNLSHWYVCYTVTPVTTTTAAEVTTTTAEVTTTTAEATTTTAEVTTTTAEVTTTTAEATTTTEVGSEGPTTTTTIVEQETTTTEVGSEGPTTTIVQGGGPTTTAQSSGGGSLPQTGSGADVMLVLGLGLVIGGVVVTALGRRTDHA